MQEGAPSVIVVGLGSIGRRHVEVLRSLGERVATVSRRVDEGDFATVVEASRAWPQALLLIATETADHAGALMAAAVAGHRGPLVVEKPLAVRTGEVWETPPLSVAYNLRFSPVVQAFRTALGDEPALSVRMHVGQHLSTWRPGTTTADSYSAHASQGGGVLRDLSHDLDLATWLFGAAEGVCALGGRRAAVTVDSDDCWNVLLRTRQGSDVSVSLNYLDRPARRTIEATTATRTLAADLVGQTLTVDGETRAFAVERNVSYEAMWRDVLASWRTGAESLCCTRDEAVAVLELVEAIERSAQGPAWVSL